MQLLKRHVKEHWTPESSKFREPPIEDSEKAAIRAALPAGLADPNSKLRTAVGMAVASIAKWDVPQEWPTLLPELLRAISERSNASLGAALPGIVADGRWTVMRASRHPGHVC